MCVFCWAVLCIMQVHILLIIINNNSRNTFNFFPFRSCTWRRAQDDADVKDVGLGALGFCLTKGITAWHGMCVCWVGLCWVGWVCVRCVFVLLIPRATCCHFCLNDIALTAPSPRQKDL